MYTDPFYPAGAPLAVDLTGDGADESFFFSVRFPAAHGARIHTLQPGADSLLTHDVETNFWSTPVVVDARARGALELIGLACLQKESADPPTWRDLRWQLLRMDLGVPSPAARSWAGYMGTNTDGAYRVRNARGEGQLRARARRSIGYCIESRKHRPRRGDCVTTESGSAQARSDACQPTDPMPDPRRLREGVSMQKRKAGAAARSDGTDARRDRTANRGATGTGDTARSRSEGAVAHGSGAQGRITRQTVTDLALVVLREKILHGEYEEGEPLRQDALAAELGVSRIPVREALRQLEAEGLVSFSPHAGAVVSTLSLSEIEELFAIRGLLESEVLRQSIPALTEEDLDRADAALEAYEVAFERHDVAQWGALNWRFHSTLMSAANRPLTLSVLSGLHNQSDRYMRMQLALTQGEVRAIGEHRAIAAAVRRRAVDEAVTLLRHHIVSAGQSLIEFLRVHRTPSSDGSRSSDRRNR